MDTLKDRDPDASIPLHISLLGGTLAALIVLPVLLGSGLLGFVLVVHTGLFDPWWMLSFLDDHWPWLSHVLDGVLALPRLTATGPDLLTFPEVLLLMLIGYVPLSMLLGAVQDWRKRRAPHAQNPPRVRSMSHRHSAE